MFSANIREDGVYWRIALFRLRLHDVTGTPFLYKSGDIGGEGQEKGALKSVRGERGGVRKYTGNLKTCKVYVIFLHFFNSRISLKKL